MQHCWTCSWNAPSKSPSLSPAFGKGFQATACDKVGQTHGQPQLNFPQIFFRLSFHMLLWVAMATVDCLLLK